MEKKVTIPEGVETRLEGNVLTAKGPKGEVSREFRHPKCGMKQKDGKFIVTSTEDRRKANAVAGTWAAHIRNMCTGASVGWEIRMKAVHSHFPIKMNVEGDRLVIQNFLGGRKPITAKVPAGVEIKINKDEITVSGVDKELVGQACGNIENSTRVTGRDKRVFQDGVYILGKSVPQEEKK